MRKLLRSYQFWVLLVLVAGGLTWALWPQEEYPFTVSPDTTYLTRPLNPDGTVNYVAALNERFSKGVTRDNNAAPLLIRAWGAEIIDESVRDRVFEILQMEPVPEEGLGGRDLRVIIREVKAAGKVQPYPSETDPVEVMLRAISRPWSGEESPVVAAWVKENEKLLQVVAEATKRSRFYIPAWHLVPPSPCMLRMWRDAEAEQKFTSGSIFVARAMSRVDRGDVDGACADLMTAHRLARLLGQGPSLVDCLTGVLVELAACYGEIGLATSGKLSHQQCREHLAELRKLPEMPGVAEPVLLSRLWGLNLVAGHYRGEEAVEPGRDGAIPYSRQETDWNRELRKVNAWFNRHEQAVREPRYADSAAVMRALGADRYALYRPIFHESGLMGAIREIKQALGLRHQHFGRGPVGDLVITVILIHPLPFRDVYERCRMHLGLAKVSLALAGCKKEKGRFPAKLSDLAPAYLKDVPGDSFTDSALIYRPRAKGYLLYSLGPNMKDDGGEGDDIVVRVK